MRGKQEISFAGKWTAIRPCQTIILDHQSFQLDRVSKYEHTGTKFGMIMVKGVETINAPQ
jgi:hypothetical protein